MLHELLTYLTKHDAVFAQAIAIVGVTLTNCIAIVSILEKRREARTAKEEAKTAATSVDLVLQTVTDNSLRDGVNLHAINDAILEAANVAIILCDENCRVFQWNDAACALFGWTEHEARGRSVTFIMPADMRGRHLAALAEYQETGQSRIIGTTVAVQAQHKNGMTFPVSLSLSTGEMVDGRKFYCGVIAPLAVLSPIPSSP